MNSDWATPEVVEAPRWTDRGVLFLLVLMLAGLLAGMLASRGSLVELFGLAVAGGLLVAAVLRWPDLGPALFWLAYGLQYTVFSGFSITGLYYPLYALMAINAFLALARRRVTLNWRLGLYALFLLTVLVSLLPVVMPIGFNGKQRLFMYAMGFLVFFQFPSGKEPRKVVVAQVLATLAIAGWVVGTSAQHGFPRRAGILANQNDTSFILGFGLLAMLATFAARKLSAILSVALLAGVGAGVYALLLLASRGIGLAFAVSALAILGRNLRPARRSLSVLLALVVAGVVIFNLPGSDSLFQRFQSADVATANGRALLWRTTLDQFEHSNAYQLLLGHGFQSAQPVIRRANVTLTSTHNVYLQLLYDEGLIGLLAFISLHLVLLRRFWRTRSLITLYGASAVVLMLVAGLTMSTADNFLYWVATGQLLAMAAYLDGRDRIAKGGALALRATTPMREGER